MLLFRLLLTKYLGGKAGVVKMLKRQAKQIVPWPSPCCCLQAHLNADFLLHIKRGTMQYVIISPIASFIAVVCGALDIYGDGVIDWTRGYVYIAIVQNVTQIVALYCLIWFYMISKDELAAFNPLAKFLVVKSVVFFTFWQGVGINLLVKVLLHARCGLLVRSAGGGSSSHVRIVCDLSSVRGHHRHQQLQRSRDPVRSARLHHLY